MAAQPGFRVSALRDAGPLFTDNNAGACGFDGAYSIPLEDGRSLWFFGDTLIGSRTPGASLWYPDGKPIGAREMAGTGNLQALVTNSGIVLDRAENLQLFRFITDKQGRPGPLIERTGTETEANIRLWCLHGMELGGVLYLYYQLVQILVAGCGFPVCFEILGSGCARGDSKTFRFERIPAPGAGGIAWDASKPQFAAAVLERQPYLYLYGIRKPGPLEQQCCVARVRPDSVENFGRYEYWNGSSWSKEIAEAATIFTGPPNEVSVSWNGYLGAYLAVHSIALTGKIVARTAPEPQGPWSEPVELTDIVPARPKSLPYPPLVYAGKEHPELSPNGGRTIAVTYIEFEEYFPHLLYIDLERT